MELAEEMERGTSGLIFARDDRQWIADLGRLLSRPEERALRSAAAREIIDHKIWADVQYPRLRAALFERD